MSHTTTIATVLITNEAAFKAAVDELKRRGVLKGELREGGKPRAYYSDQRGMGEADFVLDLSADGAAFDVGFYRNEQGGLEARTDFYGGSVARVLGNPPGEGDDRHAAQLGKLYQQYAIEVTEREYVQQGLNVQRFDLEDGSIQLEVTG